MAIILNIDTSGSRGMLALASEGQLIQTAWNDEAMQHASFIQPAIQQLLKDAGIKIGDIDAIAVSNGPGSYTGLRVGLASAKGLCYALGKPLITLSTLQVMAFSVCQQKSEIPVEELKDSTAYDLNEAIDYRKSLPVLYCPMIDARRMEVFFALYDEHIQQVMHARAAIVDKHFLQDYADSYQVIAVGNGAGKWQGIAEDIAMTVVAEPLQDKALSALSYQRFILSKFDSLVDVEPFYAKEFHSTSPTRRL